MITLKVSALPTVPKTLPRSTTVSPAPVRARSTRWQALHQLVARCPEPGCGLRGCPGLNYHAAMDIGWRR